MGVCAESSEGREAWPFSLFCFFVLVLGFLFHCLQKEVSVMTGPRSLLLCQWVTSLEHLLTPLFCLFFTSALGLFLVQIAATHHGTNM